MSSFISAAISSPPGNATLQLQNFKLKTQQIIVSSGISPPTCLSCFHLSAFLEVHIIWRETRVLKGMGLEINNKHENSLKESHFTLVSCMSEQAVKKEKKRGRKGGNFTKIQALRNRPLYPTKL